MKKPKCDERHHKRDKGHKNEEESTKKKPDGEPLLDAAAGSKEKAGGKRRRKKKLVMWPPLILHEHVINEINDYLESAPLTTFSRLDSIYNELFHHGRSTANLKEGVEFEASMLQQYRANDYAVFPLEVSTDEDEDEDEELV